MSPGVPKHSGAHRTICSSVAAWPIADSASAGITIDSPMPAQPQNSSSMKIGSDRPVGSPTDRVELPAVEALAGSFLEHRPRELLGAVVLGRDRTDHVAGERMRPLAQRGVLVGQIQREAHEPARPFASQIP